MKTKRKKEKMNTPETATKPAGKRPVFLKMGIPDSLRGNPCCTVRDPEKEKELKTLLKSVSKKRDEESNKG